jgi:hypothetical protein
MSEIDSRFEDYSVIIVSAILREEPEFSFIGAAGISFPDGERGPEAKVEVVELLQTKEAWPDVIARAERIANSPSFDMQAAGGDIIMLVDNTMGTASITSRVLNGDCYAVCVVVSNERTTREDGNQSHIPKRDIVGALVSAYQEGRIEVSGALDLAEPFASEVSRLSLRDLDTTGDIALLVGHIVRQADAMLPSELDSTLQQSATYDTDNWGLE